MTDFIPAFDRPPVNRQLRLARRPAGNPVPGDFAFAEAPVPEPLGGELLVRNLYLSADPVQRGWAANPELTPLDAPMRALAVGVVTASRAAGVHEGDVVYGHFGWQDYCAVKPAELMSHVPSPGVPIAAYAGVLGMPGITGWLALMDLAPPKRGDLLLVSTAAGTVGSVVGQIARRLGARPVGLAGSDDKVARCLDLYGYEQAFNYKAVDLGETLAQAAPEGFDIYFDNTGGPILDTALRHMALHGRVIACGTAATPSWSPPPTGLRNEREVLMRRLTWSGFIIFDHIARFGEAIAALEPMLRDGSLRHDEEITDGLEAAPETLGRLLAGQNQGKPLIFIG